MKTFIVDSFTGEPFKGNPAGVCIADGALNDSTMLSIARELNLSETAFIQPQAESGSFAIRYFSPKMEIPLCGHATLASAKVVFEMVQLDQARFVTVQNIILETSEFEEQITMRFPLYETHPADVPESLLAALGIERIENAVYNEENKILMLEIGSPEMLSGLKPDFDLLLKSHDSINGVLVTSPGLNGYDFYSRYFWPWSGTNEDPVTGATHTFLAPYWSRRLNKLRLRSFQCSERTGFMDLEILEKELLIRSKAVIIFEGQLRI